MSSQDPIMPHVRNVMESLAPKEVCKTMRNSLRKEARRARKCVLNQLHATRLNVTKDIDRTVRAHEYRNLQGVYVTVAPTKRGLKGQYATRHGKKASAGARVVRYKPIAFWAAGGTRQRSTVAGKRRGAMPDYRFMNNSNVIFHGAEQRLEESVKKNIDKIIAKHGC